MVEFPELSGWAIALPVIVIIMLVIFRLNRSKNTYRSHFSTDYFKGLNYLLNDEQGKALDIFVKLAENDWETVDTHFALGKIFRRNGEIDKAIKVHQGLIARPSLPEKLRNRVLLELGYDYLGAGWFDRAEGLFKEVLVHDQGSENALQNLILIYQQEKDWHKAIDAAENLYSMNPAKVGPMISQYYCELADVANAKGDVNQVENFANQALRYNPASVRASIILADLAMSTGDYTKAKLLLQQIEKQDAEFLPMVMDKLAECHQHQGETEKFLDYLDQLETRQNNLPLLETHAQAIERYKGQDAAIDYVIRKMGRKPSLEAMNQLLSYRNTENNEDFHEIMIALRTAVNVMKQEQAEYQCKQCGFRTNTLYWLCPSCHHWGSVKPFSCEPSC